MATTITIDFPEVSGEAGPFSIWLRKRSDKALVNTGGDSLSEIEVATVKTGVWSATIDETIPAEDCYARVYQGATETPANILFGGILYNGQTEVDKVSVSGLNTEQANQLAGIAAAVAGGAVESTARIASGGMIITYVGDDFRVRSTTALTIPVSDPAGGLYDLLSDIGESNLAWGASLPGRAAGLITGTIESLSQSGSGADTVCNITIEISDCGVGLKVSDDYVWQIESTQTHDGETDTHIRVEGTLSLRRNVVS